jgi:hypothetical protein
MLLDNQHNKPGCCCISSIVADTAADMDFGRIKESLDCANSNRLKN